MKRVSGSNKQSSRRLNKQGIKKRLKGSLLYNENTDSEDLNEQANIVERYEEAMDITKEYKDIIETKGLILHINKVKFFKNLRKLENLKVLLRNLK